MNRILGIAALFSFCIAVYFGIREPMSLFIIIPLSVLFLAYQHKIGVIVSCVGVIIICVGSVVWVNSITPILGDEYTSKKDSESLQRAALNESVNIIVSGKNAVKEKLKDPSSAKFMNDFSNFYEGKGYYCGLVDSKNSFGAYNGMQKFVSNGSISGTFLQEEVTGFSSTWDKFCE